jgi:Zn-dependent metalloprotease
MSLWPPRRNPLYCVVPPYMMEGVLRNALSPGDVNTAERTTRTTRARHALQTLQTDNVLRTARVGLSETARPLRQAARVVRFAEGLAAVEAAFPPRVQRTVFDARHRQRLPGVIARAERDPPTGDLEVDEAFEGLGDTFAYYSEVLSRDSIDGRGMPLRASVHFGVRYDNAMWDGRQMIFGDGDGITFERFTITVDIVGHELTHGVTEHEASLAYWGQSGALNESISDVFGSLVKQYKHKQSAKDADWLIGADVVTGLKILAPDLNGEALRSMKTPGEAFNDPRLGGKDPQPGHMDDYVHGMADNFGVHANSGIPNRAFYLVATALDGNAYEDPGEIWYQALSSPLLRPNANFRSFAQITQAVADREFGPTSREAAAVQEAWNTVGILS